MAGASPNPFLDESATEIDHEKLRKLEAEVRRELSKFDENEHLNILVIGKPGSGKSSFINSMHMAVAHRWHEVANYGDGRRAVTTDLIRYLMFQQHMTYPPIPDYKHNVFFWDTAGLEDLNEEIFEAFLGLTMEGRIPPDTNVHEYTDMKKPSPPSVKNLKRMFPRSQAKEENKCHRIVFLCAANEEPPANLMTAVTNAGSKDKADARSIPIFLVMSKCDKVGSDILKKDVYESRADNAAKSLMVAGNPQRCKAVSLYCNELTGLPSDDYDPSGMKNDDNINKKMLNLWMSLLDPAYRVKHAPPKKSVRKTGFFNW